MPERLSFDRQPEAEPAILSSAQYETLRTFQLDRLAVPSSRPDDQASVGPSFEDEAGNLREITPEDVLAIRHDTRELTDENLALLADYHASAVTKRVESGQFWSSHEVALAAILQERAARNKIEAGREDATEIRQLFRGAYRIIDYRTNSPATTLFFSGHDFLMTDPGTRLAMATEKKEQHLRTLQERYGVELGGIALTHAHPDHTAAIGALTNDEVPIYRRQSGQAALESPHTFFEQQRELVMEQTGGKFAPKEEMSWKILWPKVASLEFDSIENWQERLTPERFRDFPEKFVMDGYTIEPIHLPGHAPDETAFYVPEHRLMIGGDLLPNRHPKDNTFPTFYSPEANVYAALESLKKISALDLAAYFPAHGQPLEGEDLRERLATATRLVEYAMAQTADLHNRWPELSVAELAKRLSADPAFPKSTDYGQQSWQTVVISVLRDRPVESKD